MKRNEGFSLVELIIVVAIMSILIGVLAPQYIKYVEKSRKSADEKVARQLLEVANVITADVDWFAKIEVGDYIEFGSGGIATNNQTIRDEILPQYISGWQGVKVLSKTYKNKTYKVEFVNDSAENRIALQVGWI